MEVESLQEKLGVRFKDPDLLKEALTHRSYKNENLSWCLPHNERLEFLGDAVLELVTTDFLFKNYPSHDEGRLTSVRAALVNYQNLSAVARSLGLDTHLLMSKGEEKDTGRAREVLLANAFEAVLGALYLDAGYDRTRSFVETHVLGNVEEIFEKNLDKDPKSLLQELVQEQLKITPSYEVVSEQGPDHNKVFKVGVHLGGKCIAYGEGFSKQEAEVDAARKGLHVFKTS